MNDVPITVTLRVVRALEQAGAQYAIAGSVASSLHGMARATLDADIVTDLHPDGAARFASALGDDFYVEAEAIVRATAEGRHFNVIHQQSGFKADVYVAGDDAFAREELARRRLEPIGGPGGAEAYFVSPEDVILAKLMWYRADGEVSDRQWSDAIGVLRVQSARLDQKYLGEWAARLDVADLLERAAEDAHP